jgi:hypothetical protein
VVLQGLNPETPTEPVATGRFQRADLVAWRIACLDRPDVLIPFLKMSDFDGCSEVNLSVSYAGQQPLISQPLQCGIAVPLVSTVTPGPHGTFGPLALLSPDHDAVVIRLNGLIVATLAAVPFPPNPPVVSLASTGCRPCETGDQATVEARVQNSSSDPIIIEIRSVMKLPDGTEIVLPPDTLQEVPAGLSVLTVFNGVVVPESPTGSYVFETALLSPGTGVTLSRARLRIERAVSPVVIEPPDPEEE